MRRVCSGAARKYSFRGGWTVRLAFATSAFVVGGSAFEGFPLLMGKDGWPVEPAHEFLWETLVLSGGADSGHTWEAYGRWLHDYFEFLEDKGLRWDERPAANGLSVLAQYRNWLVSDRGLTPKTINKRLALAARLYQWCKLRGYIDQLPFTMRASQGHSKHGFLAHTKSNELAYRPSVMVREHRAAPKLLTEEQAKVCSKTKFDDSHRILFDLMVKTGLRSCEARTFPASYVFNPRDRQDLKPGRMIRVELHPKDMHLKFDKPRTIDMPWSLMEDLYQYSLHERVVRRKKSSGSPSALALTNYGSEFSEGAVVEAMRCIEKKVGFHVRAHMLRHTYGTFTLMKLLREGFKGDPSLYVRDQLGHSSVMTTSIYLHLVNQLEAQAILAHDEEMDLVCDMESEMQQGGA